MKYIVHAMMEFEVEANTPSKAAAKVREIGGDVRGEPQEAEQTT